MVHAQPMEARMRLGDFLVAYLRRAEVDCIFGIPSCSAATALSR